MLENTKDLKVGDTVYVSGEVFYGDTYYRVASNGIIEDINKCSMIVNLEDIDGDRNVCVLVKNKYIRKA